MRLNLNFLNTFLVVAEHSSFRRAADEVCRSQSAVSMQIRQLEEDLGVFLFRRTTRKVELTSEGERLVQCARKALEDLSVGVGALQKAAALRKGMIRLGCVPTFTDYMPPVLSRLAKLYPGVEVSIQETSTLDVLAALSNEDVEIGIAPRLDGMPDLEFDFIAYDELYALLPERFALPGRSEITLEELSHVPIMMQRGPEAIQAAENEAFERRGVVLRPSHEIQQAQTLVSMAAKGIGVAVMTRLSLPAVLPSNLQLVRIPDLATIIETCVVTLRGRPLSPVARDLKALIHEIADQNDLLPPRATTH